MFGLGRANWNLLFDYSRGFHGDFDRRGNVQLALRLA
jgi:hypothetical protein